MAIGCFGVYKLIYSIPTHYAICMHISPTCTSYVDAVCMQATNSAFIVDEIKKTVLDKEI